MQMFLIAVARLPPYVLSEHVIGLNVYPQNPVADSRRLLLTDRKLYQKGKNEEKETFSENLFPIVVSSMNHVFPGILDMVGCRNCSRWCRILLIW